MPIAEFVFIGWVFFGYCFLFCLLVFVSWIFGSWCDFWSSRKSSSELESGVLGASVTFDPAVSLCLS